MSSALAGRRVFVTGATGFLGTHLTRALLHAGAEVHALVRRPAASKERMHQHVGDITDPRALRAAFSAADPAVVFHLAAYGTTPVQSDAALMREVNVGGTEQLWAAADRSSCRIVQTGTSAEYAAKAGALVEDDPCRPASDYASTVHDAVMFSRERACRSGRELVILRPFGPYGPNDRPERLVPHVIDALLNDRPVKVTPGEQRRDYSHVDDHVTALLTAATIPLVETARVYNIGSGGPIRVRTLVEEIASAVGGHSIERVMFGAVPYRPDDLTDRFGDISAAGRDLGYVPSVSLADGLRRTVEAYRAYRASLDSRAARAGAAK